MTTTATDSIISAARNIRLPDHSLSPALSVKDAGRIATEHNVSIRDVEITALENAIIPERYIRNRTSLSLQDQITLLQKSVCIVGLGGLGGTVSEMLARLGVGKLILIDGDVFEDSNLNRQLLSTMKTLGASKAQSAAYRVNLVNPAVEVVCHTEFLTAENAHRLTSDAPDLIIDCLDNVKTRFLLEDLARKSGSVMVSGAVAGNTGQVTTIFPEDPGLVRIYGNPDKLPERGVEVHLGTLPYAVALVAVLECAEATKVLLNRGIPLRNKLLIINPLENLYEIMQIG
ncbi:MAG: HesA/MoeB/ThiF family protein [Desulfobacterales bacterium]